MYELTYLPKVLYVLGKKMEKSLEKLPNGLEIIFGLFIQISPNYFAVLVRFW